MSEAPSALASGPHHTSFGCDSVQASICEFDVERGGRRFNRAWELFTGIAPADLLRDAWLNAVHEEDRVTLGDAALEGGSRSVDIRIQDRNGQYHWFLVNIALPTDAHLPRSSRTLVALPINERKASEVVRDAESADIRMMLQNVPTMIWRTTAAG